jgi:AcrR family transcriptional regulator
MRAAAAAVKSRSRAEARPAGADPAKGAGGAVDAERAGADTRTRILDAAELLFSERGFDAVSLREITAAAQVNNAAVFYHFGHKDDLFAAVFERRSAPLERERQRRLDLLLAGPRAGLTVESLIEAYLAPGLIVGFGSNEARMRFGRLRARITAETDARVRELLRRYYREPGRRFLEGMARLLPKLSAKDLQWRFHVMIATIIYTMGKPGRVQAVADEPPARTYDPDDMEEAVRVLVPLLAAIFRAPPVGAKSKRRARRS